VNGFGIGAALYEPGCSVAQLRQAARDISGLRRCGWHDARLATLVGSVPIGTNDSLNVRID
jgi:hypothetical protein